ncbi:GNAT family N-acetyltransferase [Streptomyces sp. NBC_01571]|uniref:GNAT family N-acetyltransferase n=1 Tax=Streptomyces sp. NBC_01571 TaxID=2975883 RepID=UPI00225A5CE5|nr:GNAT family N-acetyltransferase [Streptomyces sp. NBC_01571]MCX4578619.1 GNAT family N-acetyltransferase [Streptomyces sp. NBC_01571]
MSGVRVREMTLADCDRVSEIRVRGWQAAYKGLMPQSYLDSLSTEQDAARRRGRFGQGGGAVVNLVAERAGEVVGWACHGPYRDGEVRATDVELYAIYVDPDRTGAGVGRALLREAAERCATAGYERMLLWVLKENTGARGFYEHAGFGPDGAEEPFEAGGVEVPEVRYVRALTDTPATPPPSPVTTRTGAGAGASAV